MTNPNRYQAADGLITFAVWLILVLVAGAAANHGNWAGTVVAALAAIGLAVGYYANRIDKTLRDLHASRETHR